MPNIASLLKTEIARLARKEVKAHVEAAKKLGAQHRSEIAALKRRVQDLERGVRQQARTSAASSKPPADDGEAAAITVRFSAKGLATHRRRLGLSAEDFGKLVGASGLSIYKWESGKSKPQARFLPAIAEVRTMGKKEAAKRLEAAG